VFASWDARWVACSGAWLLATAWSVATVWRGRWSAFALLWFLIVLAPSHSLLARLDIANDRHLYLAALPLYAALAHLWNRASRRARRFSLWERAMPATHSLWERAMPATIASLGSIPAAAALALLLLTATVLRNNDYRGETAFWSAVLARDEANARAWNNLGYALERERPGELDAARRAYRRAIELDPADYKPRHNLARLGMPRQD
jgi:tetratricopeptide (TPR) repeat protein